LKGLIENGAYLLLILLVTLCGETEAERQREEKKKKKKKKSTLSFGNFTLLSRQPTISLTKIQQKTNPLRSVALLAGSVGVGRRSGVDGVVVVGISAHSVDAERTGARVVGLGARARGAGARRCARHRRALVARLWRQVRWQVPVGNAVEVRSAKREKSKSRKGK
jgi:hypothetical protein